MGALRREQGVLMVEGVIAAFLMVFAFAAASSLFDASLRWEAVGANKRRAALVAERALGEIRAQLQAGSGSFESRWASIPATMSFEEAPGFDVTIDVALPTYKVHSKAEFNKGGGSESIPPGLYSPTSHLWVPDDFGSANPPLPSLPNDFDDPQKDDVYKTYARVRTFPESARRVQVTVVYGDGTDRTTFRLVSLVADEPPRGTPQAEFRLMSGPSSLGVGAAADYSVTIRVAGEQVDDVVCLWGTEAIGTGAINIKPHDTNGRAARIWRDPNATAGTTRLYVRGRYRGVEFLQYSAPIQVN